MLPGETIVRVYRGPNRLRYRSIRRSFKVAPLSASCPAVARHTKIENTVRDIDIEVAMPSPFAVQIASNRLGRAEMLCPTGASGRIRDVAFPVAIKG